VGHFPANPFGIYDMCGNVWEWTASAYSADYNGSELRAANDNDHEYRMLRGGSWKDSADHLRSACRIRRHFTERTHFIGFRIARDN
jgi:formylglycine-generating enzyme required for sulfatase activity